ncbi:MAG: hypothetical protein A3G33_01390 [Omnitrophica bacterium RIFCSPLOWO2_12_FULL_44_17]|uniref:Tyr recombinase domain-containing protein n=1 Tax=Candidatus Danuiimicrobium aquiferis TaxID=1801832 RepID=A0A1G1L1P7_9BACT|nr:MAG: hypothetical protein A3B72_00620 [Omnitrophica bacterium RIFCSPHIGHO2_02_FULL_45_28]OGW91981.1 MAG: hypothetical protein A3E74_08460 [Omnitrophica bacterium RIFCSPHIGHO2_12_FULL_44_12]OGW99056.1 MAG: hypothetical protein A3G33_01390 [Omnitrophica bacterium RIFCSPLOWO2_12_FULL_44_17]OGX04131.1 MAG: hypothetical protein A3J12_11040 [Omnitrophica bacterium RIFCSPLOWO2_02_FULL_44_11]
MAQAFLHKRGKVYYARYRNRNGKECWKSFKTNSKEIANAKLAKLVEALEKDELGWLNPKPISEYLPEYLAICGAEHSPKTLSNEKKILDEFLKFCGAQTLNQITVDRVEAFKVKRVHKVSKSTVNREVSVIKAFLNRAVALGYLNRHPAQFVKKFKEDQKQIQFLSDEEIKKLLAVCSPKMKQIVTIFLTTGMRLGELTHLRWKDVDFRHKQIIIQNRPDWTTKSHKPRVIPMHPVTFAILSSLPKDYDYVFPTRDGATIDSYIRQEIARYADKAGVHASVKMFRSTFASNLVMSGVDIYAVSKLLGHHDVKITEKHYAHLTPDFLSHSVQRLSFEFDKKKG